MSPAMARTNLRHRGAPIAQRIKVTVDRAMAFLRIVRGAATPFAISVPRTYIENIFLYQCNIRRKERLLSYTNSILGAVFLRFAHPGAATPSVYWSRLVASHLSGRLRSVTCITYRSDFAGGMGPLGPPPVSSLASLRS